MTAPTRNNGRQCPDRRAGWRRELADLLDVAPDMLSDDARLADDAGLDSLAMMNVLAWLETKGVSTVEPAALRRVGDVFTLLERIPAAGKLSYVVVGSRGGNDPTILSRPGDTGSPPVPAPRPSSLAPALGNRAYRLATITDADLDFLYSLAVHPETSYRWRYRGNPPAPDRFAAELHAQVLVQFVVRAVDTDEPAGLVVAYAADLGQGHAYVGAVFRPEHAGAGLAADITAVFVRYLFHTFPLRKLYLEVPGFNWSQVRSAAGRLFQVEGVLRGHDYFAGRHWDRYLCAIYPPGAEHAPAAAEATGGTAGTDSGGADPRPTRDRGEIR